MIKSALFVDANWSKYKAGLDVPEFHDTLEAFQDYNSSVINKEGLDLATAGCNVSINYNIFDNVDTNHRWYIFVLSHITNFACFPAYVRQRKGRTAHEKLSVTR